MPKEKEQGKVYRVVLFYNEEFNEEVKLFKRLINLDTSFERLKLKNKKQRFSAAVRELIKLYNSAKKEKLLKESKRVDADAETN